MSQVFFEADTGIISDVLPDKVHPGSGVVTSHNWSGSVESPFKCLDVELDAKVVKRRIADAVGMRWPTVASATKIDIGALPPIVQSQLTTGTRGLATTDQLVAAVSLADGVSLDVLNGVGLEETDGP